MVSMRGVPSRPGSVLASISPPLGERRGDAEMQPSHLAPRALPGTRHRPPANRSGIAMRNGERVGPSAGGSAGRMYWDIRGGSEGALAGGWWGPGSPYLPPCALRASCFGALAGSALAPRLSGGGLARRTGVRPLMRGAPGRTGAVLFGAGRGLDFPDRSPGRRVKKLTRKGGRPGRSLVHG